MRSFRTLSFVVASFVSLSAVPAFATEAKPSPAPAEAKVEKCEHGVRKALCTRCNPKLAPVFKAKGDWCAEHDRPESQCALCHPDLAAQGVK